MINPDGGITTDVRNSQGWITQETDPMGRITTFTLDSLGFPTQITLPDGNTQQYQYQTAFHALTQYACRKRPKKVKDPIRITAIVYIFLALVGSGR